MQQTRPKILYLLHNYHNRGGVEEHTKALEYGLKPNFDTAALFPLNGKLCFKHNDSLKALPGDPPSWPVTHFEGQNTLRSLNSVISGWRPDIIHIQHFLNWPLKALTEVVTSGIPTAISYHEYYAVTPFFTMEHAEEPRDTFTRDYCLKVFNEDLTAYLQERKLFLIDALSKIPVHIVPSRFLAHELAKVFPREYQIIPHGIELFERGRREPSEKALRFGYLGALIPQKGWESLVAAFPTVKAKHSRAELHLYGGGENVDGLSDASQGVFFHGGYTREELPKILSQIDIGVIPSLFRETFCYVLSEMQQARLPVAAADIGALGERVRTEGGGCLFEPGNADAIHETLCWFLENETWRTWEIPAPRSLAETLENYRHLYSDLLAEQS